MSQLDEEVKEAVEEFRRLSPEKQLELIQRLERKGVIPSILETIKYLLEIELEKGNIGRSH